MDEQFEEGVADDFDDGQEGADSEDPRGHWGSKIGFILAAAGSAVGLGNIWKFPYICGENGGGAFVLVYLLCIGLVGLPIMIGEILVGRMTQKAPVGAIGDLTGNFSPWKLVGGLGVLAAFFMLSYYSVVAGWAMHYTWISCLGEIAGHDPDAVGAVFGELYEDHNLNFTWHVIFMALTTIVVLGGIQKGIERWARILMPALLIMLSLLLYEATKTEGWNDALKFVFSFDPASGSLDIDFSKITPRGVLEALGHAFFTLSLGMGAMITYGSYLRRKSGILSNAVAITVLDTVIALMACMILFPITFSYGLEPAGGPGLVFVNIPIAMSQMPHGEYLTIVFFALLVFAALTSAISLLEVVASYFIDQWKMPRRGAVLLCATTIGLFGIPSALSGGFDLFGPTFAEWKAEKLAAVLGDENGGRWADITLGNWFDFLDYLVSNWMLPLGGFFIAIFASWRVSSAAREAEFTKDGALAWWFKIWLNVLRWFVPIIVLIVMLNASGVLQILVEKIDNPTLTEFFAEPTEAVESGE